MPRTKLDAGLRELRMQMKQVGSRVEDSIQSFEFTIYMLNFRLKEFLSEDEATMVRYKNMREREEKYLCRLENH